MARVVVAKPTGFCFGVERAITMAKQGQKRYGRVSTLGELVHNPLVLEELTAGGIRTVRRVNQIRGGAVVIRAHGCPPATLAECQRRVAKVIDATCPHVRKVQNVARRLREQGYAVVVVGERNHPEVRSLLAHAGPRARVYGTRMRLVGGKIGVVAQTTMSRQVFRHAVAKLSDLRYTELRVFDTICGEVASRQQAAARIARECDLVIVVGGRNSANTSRLAEIVAAAGKKLLFAERSSDLSLSVLRASARIGVVAGSSTPDWVVQEVAAIARNPDKEELQGCLKK